MPDVPLINWPATRLGETAQPESRTLALAEETPVNLRYNTMQYAVMIATARDIEDFCVGFSITEGIVAHADEIKSITLEDGDGFITADLRIPAEPFHRLMQASRRMVVGRTGCGVCGTEEAGQVLRPLPALPPGPPTSLAAIRRGLADLSDHQTLNKQARMLHGAAWCGLEGEIRLVREDVGRHNALDKLIGAGLRAGQNLSEGFCLLTSRCSYEMVQKSIIAGFRTIVAISAPTGLALRVAQQAGLTVVAIARSDSQMLFTGKLSD
ncbi:formate dehydrogenase accessory sulfurtransferase FdhD [Acidocella aminolytica]|jgi:FdhD protein|uniref:Sulfur carrier protein FdhD n=1 Tax=Acidocella aminolytica 101 = DSM 11237 TaxID=1120923 RepID=A0A0D6PDH6_9PROT|nr:formate dehydrogenase accessory sulfurtransferase FdhD [Acidocella aminolytica]GAN78924.1 formate dehydrogenase accessory protein FdhD [Acidocella aminolytica 101 = DSM 11237]GBQ42221.1 formate dehydrogenase accessory protein FdhD [Acidocella aminolytica 101 = DSM 11237]SHE99375.1 FdhD protein [Acidocella aminolytica 101 = DSM 11237]